MSQKVCVQTTKIEIMTINIVKDVIENVFKLFSTHFRYYNISDLFFGLKIKAPYALWMENKSSLCLLSPLPINRVAQIWIGICL